MSAITVAATYRIIEKIGAGGGGVVYLAEHLRLHKKVVLKADKRPPQYANQQALRQEVDVLKNLSHTYIPQVYDYFTEGDIVYTVIDYIEGESLDKPLKRGEKLNQPQIVEWACQLLEALCYLHAQPPHGILHADIKPANIMLTSQGDIRLIDFNIALALGEEGAVKVGYSHGYASPEHYGQSFGFGSGTIPTRQAGRRPNEMTEVMEPTEVLPPTELVEPTEVLPLTEVMEPTELLPENEQLPPTELLTEFQRQSTGSRSGSERLLDVRSDIYSLGATLYHLLTGVRPVDASEGRTIKPAVNYGCSQALSDIIAKAMAANPAERFQTAAEMLKAIEHLHQNDSRTRCLRHWQRIAAAFCMAIILAGGSLTWRGLSGMERLQTAYVLAEYSTNAMQNGDVQEALNKARESLARQFTAQGQRALVDALGVYDLADGYKVQKLLAVPSEPIKIAVSPNGQRAVVLCQNMFYVYDLSSGELLTELSAVGTVAADAVFINDDLLVYAGAAGVTAYDLAAEQQLWQGNPATKLTVSADGRRLAAVYQNDSLARIYDTTDGQLLHTVDFAGRTLQQPVNENFADTDDTLLVLNRDGSRLAVSFADGGLWVFEVANPENWLMIFDKSDFRHFEGGFAGEQSEYLAFAVQGGGQNVFAIIDVLAGAQTGGFQSGNPYHVQTDESGIYLSSENLLVQINPVSGEQNELAYTSADIKAFAVRNGVAALALTDNSLVFYANSHLISSCAEQFGTDFIGLGGEYAVVADRSTPDLQIWQLEHYPEAQLVAYDSTFVHDEARLSADWQTVMLFDFEHFRIYDLAGNVLAERNLPADKQVYDQQYRRADGNSYLEVIYYDGLVQKYSAADGSLLEGNQINPPNPSLDEEFLTESYRVEAPLHGAPKVYDRDSGNLLRELNSDAYLTYVTQIDNLLLTEYVAADGRRWGLLLDENLEEIAYMPGLCDYLDGEFIFDYYSGYLRTAKLYTLDELLQMAQDE